MVYICICWYETTAQSFYILLSFLNPVSRQGTGGLGEAQLLLATMILVEKVVIGGQLVT